MKIIIMEANDKKIYVNEILFFGSAGEMQSDKDFQFSLYCFPAVTRLASREEEIVFSIFNFFFQYLLLRAILLFPGRLDPNFVQYRQTAFFLFIYIV